MRRRKKATCTRCPLKTATPKPKTVPSIQKIIFRRFAIKIHWAFLITLPVVPTAFAEVRVFVQSSNAVARVNYECTAGEVVRAFALDVSVDTGQIIGISDYFRGLSTVENQGYGIFPASFRDNITVDPWNNINWNASEYTPLAVMADNPVDTLAGLNSSGVTLELGGFGIQTCRRPFLDRLEPCVHCTSVRGRR